MFPTLIVAGFVVAGIRPALTVGGMHHVMTPMFFNNFETKGYDFLMPLCFMANMAMGGAAFGVLIKCKMAFIAASLGAAIA